MSIFPFALWSAGFNIMGTSLFDITFNNVIAASFPGKPFLGCSVREPQWFCTEDNILAEAETTGNVFGHEGSCSWSLYYWAIIVLLKNLIYEQMLSNPKAYSLLLQSPVPPRTRSWRTYVLFKPVWNHILYCTTPLLIGWTPLRADVPIRLINRLFCKAMASLFCIWLVPCALIELMDELLKENTYVLYWIAAPQIQL